MTPAPTFDFRSATIDDAADFARVQNACSQAEVGFDWATEENARRWLESPEGSLDDDFLVAVDADGVVVGFATINSSEPADMWTHVFVHPDHNGRGIGSTLLERTMARADALAAAAGPDTQCHQRLWRWTAHEAPHALFLAHGFRQCRLFFTMELLLETPPEPPAMPDGIVIRPFEAGDERAVYDVFVDTFSDHWGMTPEGYDQFAFFVFGGEDFDPGLLLIARDGEHIVGFADSSPNPAHGAAGIEVHGLGVRTPWRGRGVGLALLQQSFVAMYERGFRYVILDVEAENPTGAVALYQKAGMRLKAESVIYERRAG